MDFGHPDAMRFARVHRSVSQRLPILLPSWKTDIGRFLSFGTSLSFCTVIELVAPIVRAQVSLSDSRI